MAEPREKPLVLLTGASSGIGLALARKLAEPAWKAHYRTVATTREASLDKLAEAGLEEQGGFFIKALDVTSSSQRRAVVEELERDFGGVDILVNNAGISYRSVVEHMTEKDEWLQFRTNFFGPTHLIRLVLPHMRERREGRIINISSVGGLMAMPTMGEYSASKFALEGLSEALYYEMKPWNVKVTLFIPGFVFSDSFKRVLLSEAAEEAVDKGTTYANYYRHMSRFIEKLMGEARATPVSLARHILKIMAHPNPPLRVSGSADARLFALMNRLMPRRLYHAFLYRNLPGIKLWGTGIREEEE